MLQNELLVIVLHAIEQILQALKLYEIIGHRKGLEWTLSRSLGGDRPGEPPQHTKRTSYEVRFAGTFPKFKYLQRFQ